MNKAPLFTKPQKPLPPSIPTMGEFLRTYKRDIAVALVFVLLCASSILSKEALLSAVGAGVAGFIFGAAPFAYLNLKAIQILQFTKTLLEEHAKNNKTK